MSGQIGAEIEKGYEMSDSEKNAAYASEPFVNGAVTVAESAGRGGDTHRGLKSRHIQFLYVLQNLDFMFDRRLITMQSTWRRYWYRVVRRLWGHPRSRRPCSVIHGLPFNDDCRLECHE